MSNKTWEWVEWDEMAITIHDGEAKGEYVIGRHTAAAPDSRGLIFVGHKGERACWIRASEMTDMVTAAQERIAEEDETLAGKAEIEAADREYEIGRDRERRAIESSIGVAPAIDRRAELREEYPVAAAYLTAKSWESASNYAKSAAGSKAALKIAAGDDPTAALAAMEAEWDEHLTKHVMD